MIRKVDAKGFITTLEYDSEGHKIGQHTSISSDPKILESLTAQEKVLLESLKNAKNKSDRTSVLQDLMIFYISKALAFDKAGALLDAMTDREQIYSLKLFLAISNPNLSSGDRRDLMLNQLIQEFPDKKTYTQNLMTRKATQ